LDHLPPFGEDMRFHGISLQFQDFSFTNFSCLVYLT